MNRLWNLWCELSGTDPTDSEQKFAFNTDRRVAALSAHASALVEGFATYVWSMNRGAAQGDFLELWLAAVADDVQRREEVAEKDRQLLVAETARQQRATEERRRREEELQRRQRQAAELRREAEERAEREVERRRALSVRQQIGCLYNITAVANLSRIASRGILCHDLAADTRHDDVSDRGVQERRDVRWVGDMPLHRFANLYFNPRNAMLYRLHKYEHREVVVLEVRTDVLDFPGAVVFDGNAAARISEWWEVDDGLAHIDLNRIRSRSWLDADGNRDPELMRVMQAEVLVPQSVPPTFISGFLAPSTEVLDRALRAVGHWRGRIDQDMFFES